MFGKRFTLFHVLGFEIRADLSWLVIAVLVTWSLAVGAFPYFFKGLSPLTYWIMGVVGALGLFASILVHELAHSVVARRRGMTVGGITLWIFGGVSETNEEPGDARTELVVAIVGPLTSVALGVGFWALEVGTRLATAPAYVWGVLGYLSWLNVVLAIFNMVPAFPLDGGRVFRAFLWGRRKNLVSATRTASRVGSGFGIALIVLGALSVLTGNFIGGIWWVLIGLFVRGAARSSYQTLLTKKSLEGAPVWRLMERAPSSVKAGTTVDRFVNDVVYTSRSDLFPVTRDGGLVGYVDLDRIRTIPQAEWARHTVDELTQALGPDAAIGANTDAAEALRRLQSAGRRSLLVTDDGELEGVLSIDDLRRFIEWKARIEHGDRPPAR